MFNKAMSLLPSTRIRRRLASASGLLGNNRAGGLLGERQLGNREAVGGRRTDQVQRLLFHRKEFFQGTSKQDEGKVWKSEEEEVGWGSSGVEDWLPVARPEN